MKPLLRPLAKRALNWAAAPLGVKIVGTHDWSNTRNSIPFERTINAALNLLLSRILPITRRITTRVNRGVTGISRCAGAAWGALVAVRSQVPGGFLSVLLAPGWGLRVTVSRWQRAYWKKMRSVPVSTCWTEYRDSIRECFWLIVAPGGAKMRQERHRQPDSAEKAVRDKA